MLYELWQKTAAQRPDALALREAATGRRWTFAELRAAGEKHQPAPGETVYPQGNSVEFLLNLLAAWREGKPICPLEAGHKPPHVAPPPPPCVHLKSTSATTGQARFVAFTASQLQADADNIVATMGLRPDWPNLGAISLAHSYGFSNLILPLLLHGIPLILAPSPLPEAIRSTAIGESALTLAAVPALWQAWHDANAIPSSVKLAISAAAPLSMTLEQSVFKTHGLKIHNFYGSSECGGIAYDAQDSPRTDPTYAGTALKNVRLSLNDENCLAIHSPAAAETYWPTPDPTLGQGRFQTSDLVELRGNQVFLRGRHTDQINLAGRKLSPETVEQALLTHPAVRGCVVFGAPSRDPGRTDTIIAVVATKASEKELKDFLLQTLPAWQIPREWRIVESISTTAQGKIPRREWRARWEKENRHI